MEITLISIVTATKLLVFNYKSGLAPLSSIYAGTTDKLGKNSPKQLQ
jgi:hypothetical protein